MSERTLVLIKPDAVRRGLVGEIIGRFERKGLRPVAMKLIAVEEDLANRHYAEHTEKPFFGELISFITRGPLVAMVLEGTDAVTAAREVIGATNPLEAAPGSIRGDLAIEVTFNLVHGSDSDESAQREIERYCASPGQACSYKIGHIAWTRAREKAQATLGDKFDLRDFHDILYEGAMPLTIFERRVDERVRAKLAAG